MGESEGGSDVIKIDLERMKQAEASKLIETKIWTTREGPPPAPASPESSSVPTASLFYAAAPSGQPLLPPPCPQCGTINGPLVERCLRCGTVIAGPPAAAPTPMPAPNWPGVTVALPFPPPAPLYSPPLAYFPYPPPPIAHTLGRPASPHPWGASALFF